MKQEHVKLFFDMCSERYRMLLKRRAGEPRPWTTNPILNEWRFCNVFREDDRTTTWLREKIRIPIGVEDSLFFATIFFRWFNRVETGEKLLDLILKNDWPGVRNDVLKRLWFVEPVVTGAYMVKTPGGMDKLHGVVWCLDQAWSSAPDLLDRIYSNGTLEGSWHILQELPFMGGFFAHEIVTDLNHTHILKNAPDKYTWTNFGPGATRGLGYIVHGDEDHWDCGSARDQAEMLKSAAELLELSKINAYWDFHWPRWDMHTVEFCLCEYAKYQHALEGRRLKRRYG